MPDDTHSIARDFGRDLKTEQRRHMRRRLRWYLWVVTALNVATLLLLLLVALLVEVTIRAGFAEGGSPDQTLLRVYLWVGAVLSLPAVGLYIWALVRVTRRPISREAGLRLVFWLIVAPAVFIHAGGLFAIEVAAAAIGAADGREPYVRSFGWNGASTVFLSHFFACAFLPWTARESLRPMLPLVVMSALLALYTFWGDWGEVAMVVGASVVAMVPGVVLCWLRHARFLRRFSERKLRSVYGELKHELSAARQIHDAMFPDPVTDGPVRVRYRYEPMRQIGGDYVFIRRDEASLDAVLLDVTGHGVGAALTVNRLHGEVNRLLAERPDCGPGELLKGLNHYIQITLASHSVYATALCVRVEPGRDVMRYASAGHPPAFLAGSGGGLERLDSTAILLGVRAGDEFDPGEREIAFGAGGRLLAYTDGATEALDSSGRQLRVAGLERVVGGLDRALEDWTGPVLEAVDAHRDGAPTDDTLIIEVRRPGEAS